MHQRKAGLRLLRVGKMEIDRLVRELAEEIALPVPLKPLWEQRIEHDLKRRKRHRPHPIQTHVRKRLADRHHCPLARFDRTIVAGDQRANLSPPDLARTRLSRWYRLEPEETGERLGRGRQKLAVPTH